MSSDVEIWLSAEKLSMLGASLVARLPKSPSGCMRKAKKDGWVARESIGKGGPGGILTEYMPPEPELSAIQAFLRDNPEFFGKSDQARDADRPYAAAEPAKVLTTDGRDPRHVANSPAVEARMMMAMESSPATQGEYSEINVRLLDNCLDACSKVHGQEFDALKASQQIDYAADLYNLLVRMSHSKGEKLDSMFRLEVTGLVELLQVFIKLGWTIKFPPEKVTDWNW